MKTWKKTCNVAIRIIDEESEQNCVSNFLCTSPYVLTYNPYCYLPKSCSGPVQCAKEPF